MLIAMPRSRRGLVKASAVNWAPWSVLKIAGWPKRASASSSASTQKLESSVFDSGQNRHEHPARGAARRRRRASPRGDDWPSLVRCRLAAQTAAHRAIGMEGNRRHPKERPRAHHSHDRRAGVRASTAPASTGRTCPLLGGRGPDDGQNPPTFDYGGQTSGAAPPEARGAAHSASYVLLAPRHEGGTRQGHSGARRSRELDDHASLHAPVAGGPSKRNRAAQRPGRGRKFARFWRNVGEAGPKALICLENKWRR